MTTKVLGVHLGIYMLAGAFAWRASTSQEVNTSEAGAQLWKVDVSAIQRVHYKDDRREVELRPSADELGTYLIGTVTQSEAPKPGPEAPNPKADAGAASDRPAPDEAPEAASRASTKVEQFIGVTEANELLEQLANMNALRSLGRVTPDKLSDFGLSDEQTSSLAVDLSSGTRQLVFGGRTPGGGDFYVQDKESGNVYVLDGDLRRDVELADTRLMERELVTVPEGDTVNKVLLVHGDKRRTIVRSEEHASFWTDETTPKEKDETLTNWMKKFERLRINEYLLGEPEGYEPLVTATFESGKGEPLGQIEFGQQTREGDDKPRYIARSPQTRWWGIVLASSGSQLAQDLPTVLE